jgi:uncharacterized protein YfaS (alpha-2-macroglobulin family)
MTQDPVPTPTFLARSKAALGVVGAGARRAFRATVGDVRWQPPGWAAATGRALLGAAASARANPVRAGAIAGAAVAVVAGGWYGWHWYESRPKPVTVAFATEAPARTCYECDPPVVPNPLVLRFESSVAPLAAVGKPVAGPAAAPELRPAADGTWTWDDDRTLRFQPKADWPIGQKYDVVLPKRGLVAPQVRLASYDAGFATAPFAATVERSEFYQDPVQATEKKTVTTFAFTHPVDPASFERRLKLDAYDRVDDRNEKRVEPAPGYTVAYDKLKLHAYVHSARLPVPPKGGRAELTVAPGVRALRGGNATETPLVSTTAIPGLNSLTVSDVALRIARDERDEPSQVLMLQTSHSVLEKDIVARVAGWLLPVRNPDPKRQSAWEKARPNTPYPWSSPSEITPAVIAASTALPLDYVPNEREHVELHSFRFKADPGRFVYAKVGPELKSFGGYLMPTAVDRVLSVPEFPKELRIAHTGSLLALSGKRKITVFSRDVPALRVQVGRLLPNQLQHLVTQTSGELSQPRFDGYDFNAANLTETFTDVVRLPKLAPGQPHYEGIDVGAYLSRPGASRQGIFLLDVQAWDPDAKRSIDGSTEECDECGWRPRTNDTRLVVVTDLGLVVKRSQDGTQDLFVQSIASGEPVAGVTVEVIGRNGEPVLNATTDDAGHVRFPDLKSFKREKQPVLYLARRGGDSSFLPIGERMREFDLSRFDVGGIDARADRSALTAYLFSDRGIYRPGEEIRAGAIVRTQDWRPLPAGVPLVAEITDPRGATIRRETLRLSAAGFEEIRYTTRASAPTGGYTISLYVAREQRRDLIGSTNVTVREFLPDRLKMTTHFSAESPDGWVSPDDLKAQVGLENLYGTPATKRRITASLRLSPSIPAFAAFRDYTFRDPQAAKEGFSESLADQVTDDAGRATLDLNLKRFARATYRASLVVQGFEADGGRGVTGEAAQLVSSLPFLVGWKADGDLGYVKRGTSRSVEFVAIDPRVRRAEAKGLTLQRIERRYVSTLLKQDDGTLRYESRLKEVPLDSQPFALPASGAKLALDASTPGSYTYALVDADGQAYARVDYTVAGAANLARSLEKNAELKIALDRKDYRPGDEIELQVQAPYVGAGLITIERERVYTWKWFRTTTTASVQRIRVPDDLEGGGYVSVTFVRDPGSEEIYTSPLSYGVQPFSIALDARRNDVKLTVPELVKPGATLDVAYRAAKPGRIAIFAVDEGILQVAAYRTPDPLAHFFRKRALGVQTRQILDLILPEFRESMLSAPGGDEGSSGGRYLNPFQRKAAKPMAFWSGIVVADGTERHVQIPVPDTFNGRVRVMAVAVAADAIGTAELATTVRGDFVLTPTAPLTVTPGDEFDVGVGVANNVAGSGAQAPIAVTLSASPHFTIVGPARVNVPIAEMREGTARFRLKVLDRLGPAELTFGAALGERSASLATTLSVRPATPFMTTLRAGRLPPGRQDVAATRTLYPQFRTLDASVSVLPLALAHGLSSYLVEYPYACTEQIVSQALPGLVLADRPEFAYVAKRGKAPTLDGLVDELRLRQAADGGYRYWPGGVQVNDYVSVYAQHVLMEAADRGRAVPKDLLETGDAYLREIARRDGDSLDDERTTAYAIYLLARRGQGVGNEAGALQKRLSERHADVWRTDVAAAYLAGAYRLMRQDALADRTLAPLLKSLRTGGETPWFSPMTADAALLYVVSRHFPEKLAQLPDALLTTLVDRVQKGEYHSLAAAQTILALDAYAAAAGPRANAKLSIDATLVDGSSRSLTLPAGLFPQTAFPEGTKSLRFGNASELTGFWLVDESGFDRAPPTQPITQGLEVIREYLHADGKPATSAKVGEELTVRVRFRAIGHASIPDAVLVDLLPGGFDMVQPTAAAPEQAYVAGGGADGATVRESADEGGSDGEGHVDVCACTFLASRPADFPSFADVREDRVVIYGEARDRVQEFTYRIKATNAGRFVVPPAYGEAMYDARVRARSAAGRIDVERP